MKATTPFQSKKNIFAGGGGKGTLHGLALMFYFSIFFMPDYFGIKIGFDINMQRFFLILIWVCIILDADCRERMIQIVTTNTTNIWIVIFLFVCFYTAVYRMSINTFFNPFVDRIMVFYTTIYLLKYDYSKEELHSQIIGIGYVLCILGIIEKILKKSLFGYLLTLDGMFTGGIIREGAYRISGPAHHPLGYGLFLLILLPLACYRMEDKKIKITARLPLILLTMLNVYFTGSRSTLGIMLIELVFLFMISGRENRRIVLFFVIPLLAIAILLGIMFYNTEFVRTIVIRILTMFDAAFQTNYAQNLLGYYSQHLEDSATYRSLLPLVFTLDWLNPIVGRGKNYNFGMNFYGWYISSMDNYYIAEYISLAYPGLISLGLLYLRNMWNAMRGVLFYRDGLCQVLVIIFCAYFFNLWWVDALGTLDYIFVLFGMAYVVVDERRGLI